MKSTVDLWDAQNTTFHLLRRLPTLRKRAASGDSDAQLVTQHLMRLAGALRLALPA